MKLGNPPPIGTPINSPEWTAWSLKVAEWYAKVWDAWGTTPWLDDDLKPKGGGSVPTVKRK